MIRNKNLLFLLLAFVATQINAQSDSLQLRIDNYLSEGKFDSAKHYIHTNLKNELQKQNFNQLNYQLVKVLFIQSDYKSALEHAFTSLDNIRNPQESVKFNFMIGCIYSAISDYGKSIEYLNFVTKDTKDTTLLLQTQLLLSEIHLELKDSTECLNVLSQAYKITQTSQVDEKMKNHVAMQYGFHSQDYELCKQLNYKVIQDTSSYLSSKTYAYSMIGDCLIKQDSLKKASDYFEKFLNLTFKTQDPEQIKLAAEKLILVNEKLGNQEKANSYHKIYNEAINDSMSFSIEKYRNLYDIEKKRDLTIVQNNTFRNYVLLIVSFIALISIVLYYLLSMRNQSKKPSFEKAKPPSKKMVISVIEMNKINTSISQLIENKEYLTSNITRNLFCKENDIKSERYLSFYVNEKYKKSFSVFLNDLRVEYAYQRILVDPVFRNYKVEEIAKSSGFGSKKSFERAFTAKYKQTPFKLISSINR